MKAISIILVTYNSGEHLESCLDSVFAQDFKDYEVIVVDNASADNTKLILKKYPNVELIENQKNYGLSKALNQGIILSNGRYILCLNDDTELKNSFLSNAFKAIESKDSIGAVQPKVLKPDGKYIDTAGIYLSFLRRFFDIGKGRIDAGEFNREKYIFGACAAAALYKKEALETIKQGKEYFDEDFFYLVEDVDLAWRMQRRGWRTLYFPDAICLHIGGVSRSKNKFIQYLSMRNRYLMLIKNESLWGFLWFPIIFIFYDLWRNLFMLVTNPGYFLKASFEVAKLSPKMLKKRAQIIV